MRIAGVRSIIVRIEYLYAGVRSIRPNRIVTLDDPIRMIRSVSIAWRTRRLRSKPSATNHNQSGYSGGGYYDVSGLYDSPSQVGLWLLLLSSLYYG